VENIATNFKCVCVLLIYYSFKL